ncbi:hypothetical protein BV25DRAFT_1827617 [Artomyces pyxidatus]|uniref:Uncharacterized protein n=1 Tax=Artomyces pyxidatus TaxID=48021 RepID=A0ACB8SX49_9AGAM|nr:hypothetical protein BV25DRAFT_1827617 [Artomyces pyxidatus]
MKRFKKLFFRLHSKSLNRTIAMEPEYHSHGWKYLISRMVVSGHIANMIQLVAAAVNRNLGDAEQSLVLNTLYSMEDSLSSQKIIQRTQANLLVQLRFMKNRHITALTNSATNTTAPAKFIKQLADIVIPLTVRSLDTPEFLNEAKSLIKDYWMNCGDDLAETAVQV